MDDRVMQFRIGMFVIVASLVLVMLLIWFGESPSLFQDHDYLIVHYPQAPGIIEGIPVRKSGIRIGEVSAIEFDERPGQGDGVLVTLSLDAKYKLRAGSVPKISRGLIGDVWIDMLPGNQDGPLPTSESPRAALAKIVEGEVAPDPSNALAAATEAFQNVQGTLTAIEKAATGLAAVTEQAEGLDEILATFKTAGANVGSLAGRLDKLVDENQSEVGPALTSLRIAADEIAMTLDEPTRRSIQDAADRLASGSEKLDAILGDLRPAAADLGADPQRKPTTVLGLTLARVYRVAYDVSVLSRPLTDGRGNLNPNGSLQKLVSDPSLYNNFRGMSLSANRVMGLAEGVLKNLDDFARRIADDPAVISRGVLRR